MLGFPKHGMIALDLRHPFGHGAPGDNQESDSRLLSFRDAMMRGLLSAVLVVVLVVMFLL
jgi:hypothetical protein